MRRYRSYAAPVTQVDVTAEAEKLQAQLAGRGLTVAPNGNGHRVQCHCGWSKTNGTVQNYLDHADRH